MVTPLWWNQLPSLGIYLNKNGFFFFIDVEQEFVFVATVQEILYIWYSFILGKQENQLLKDSEEQRQKLNRQEAISKHTSLVSTPL